MNISFSFRPVVNGISDLQRIHSSYPENPFVTATKLLPFPSESFPFQLQSSIPGLSHAATNPRLYAAGKQSHSFHLLHSGAHQRILVITMAGKSKLPIAGKTPNHCFDSSKKKRPGTEVAIRYTLEYYSQPRQAQQASCSYRRAIRPRMLLCWWLMAVRMVDGW